MCVYNVPKNHILAKLWLKTAALFCNDRWLRQDGAHVLHVRVPVSPSPEPSIPPPITCRMIIVDCRGRNANWMSTVSRNRIWAQWLIFSLQWLPHIVWGPTSRMEYMFYTFYMSVCLCPLPQNTFFPPPSDHFLGLAAGVALAITPVDTVTEQWPEGRGGRSGSEVVFDLWGGPVLTCVIGVDALLRKRFLALWEGKKKGGPSALDVSVIWMQGTVGLSVGMRRRRKARACWTAHWMYGLA